MIVFGDPQFDETLGKVVKRFQAQAHSTRADSLDELRALLIHAGQIEQAVSDAAENSSMETLFQNLTDETAKCFFAAFTGNSEVAAKILNRIRKQPGGCNFEDDLPVTIKVPEGYEFYTLFPEQYCVSALRWIEENPVAKKILVVGIRSIGTSLSAVVASVLRNANRDVLRFTVRPKGNPFQRNVAFSKRFPREIAHALIVDEGPGISGSSMIAVAEALLASGIARENIFFFPGHGNPPGTAASEKILNWWNTTRRYFTSLDKIHWNGKSLRELLLEKSCEICPGRESFESFEDISNGGWRKVAYKSENEWPPVHLPFARTKFLCRAGSGEALIWKFTGLGAMRCASNKSSEIRNTIAIPAIENIHGFTASRWINGARLNRSDAPPQVLTLVGNYLCDAAGNRLSETEMFSGIRRLSEMCVANLTEAFERNESQQIEILAEQTLQFFRRNSPDESWRAYGDGRTAPHEWVRTIDGKIFKTDATGHDIDHTIIGQQSVLWDFAGAMVEWNLSEQNARPLFAAMAKHGIQFNSAVMRFFTLAYAAFRLGQTTLCAGMSAPDETEKSRLRDAAKFYADQCAARIASADRPI